MCKFTVHVLFSCRLLKQALSILSDVQDAFINNLDSVNWMDTETRKRAREKAEAMEKVLGYPDWILCPERLDEYYENVIILAF